MDADFEIGIIDEWRTENHRLLALKVKPRDKKYLVHALASLESSELLIRFARNGCS